MGKRKAQAVISDTTVNKRTKIETAFIPNAVSIFKYVAK